MAVAAAAALTLELPVGIGATSATAAVTARTHPAAVSAYCVYAPIGGVRKCLHAGEYCARRYQRQYVHYGFTCSKRDYRGDWHLERL